MSKRRCPTAKTARSTDASNARAFNTLSPATFIRLRLEGSNQDDTAIMGQRHPGRHGVLDCASYLLTTVTGTTVTEVKTVCSTETVTTTPTSYYGITETETIDVTATTTLSVANTVTVDYTKSLTSDVTETITVLSTQVANAAITAAPKDKRNQNQPPHRMPEYASVCRDTTHYRSACSCLREEPRTTTVHGPTVTNTVTKTSTKTVTAGPKIITTTVATEDITKTVATVPATLTWTTVTVSDAVASNVDFETVATKTVVSVETQSPAPSQDGTLIAGSYGVYSVAGYVGDSHLTEFYGSAISSSSDPFTFTPGDSDSVSVISAGTATSKYIYYSLTGAVGPDGANGLVSYLTATDADYAEQIGAERVSCTVDGSSNVHCAWGDSGEVAEAWYCNGLVSLASPGTNVTSICTDSVLTEKLTNFVFVESS